MFVLDAMDLDWPKVMTSDFAAKHGHRMLLRPDVAEWCNAHLSGMPAHDFSFFDIFSTSGSLQKAPPPIPEELVTPTISFATEADLDAFKLRWT